MIKSDILKDAAKSRAPSNIVLQILIFLAVFLTVYIAEGITAGIFIMPDMIKAMYDSGMMSGESYSFSEMYEFTISVATSEKAILATLFCTVFGIAFSLIYCLCIARRPASSIGMRRKGAILHYLTGLFTGAVLMAAIVWLAHLSGACRITVSPDFNEGIIILFLAGFLIQGASEEFIFRGYLMTEIGGRHSPVAAIAISSAAFAAAHCANPGLTVLAFANLMLFAVFAGLYMLLTDNIWGVCAIHSIWNFTQGNLWGIRVSGTGYVESVFHTAQVSSKTWLTGGKFGIEGSIFTTLILTAATAIVIILLIKKTRTKPNN